MSIATWTCKCGRTSVANKKKCRCGKAKPDYELKTATGTVNTGELDNEALLKKQKKEYDRKQRIIVKNLPPPEEGSVLQSAMYRREKR